MRPLPGAIVHVGRTPPTSCPPAVFADAVRCTTSPVRTGPDAPLISTRLMLFGTTSMVSVAFAVPAAAVIVARPGATAVRRPSGFTVAMAGALEDQVTR